MPLNPADAFARWDAIRTRSPLVFQLTNFVVMNEQAHVTLIIGAAPLMSLHPGEAADLATIANATVINIGTPTTEGIEAMKIAAKAASDGGKTLLVDPVGYGATPLRTGLVDEILKITKPAVIKGNHGEMSVLGKAGGRVRGVDAEKAGDPAKAVQIVAAEHDCLAIATGETDYVSDGKQTAAISGGHALLTRLTGSGCWLGTVVAAAVAAGEGAFESALVALAGYGLAAEKAGARAAIDGAGSFRIAFFDALGNLTESDFGDFERRIQFIDATP